LSSSELNEKLGSNIWADRARRNRFTQSSQAFLPFSERWFSAFEAGGLPEALQTGFKSLNRRGENRTKTGFYSVFSYGIQAQDCILDWIILLPATCLAV